MFSQEFNIYYKELAKNNNRDWFHANKKRYEEHVKKPFYLLIETLLEKIKKYEPGMILPVKDAVFRINRDIRFSKDQRP